MDREHKRWIEQQFRGLQLPPIQVLDIPDSLVYMDPELQRMLRAALDPEMERLLSACPED
jgi:predicted protein tyrosine phosphatase